MTADPVNSGSVNLPTRRDALANRERVLDAAREVFAERGAEAEIREIADRAGVGIGTVYRNFPSKDALVDGLIMQLQSQIRPLVEEAARIEDPVEALTFLLRRATARVEEYGIVLALMIEQRPDTVRHAKNALMGQVVEVIRRGAASGQFRTDVSPEFIMRIFEASMPHVYLAARETHSVEEATEGIVAMYLSAARGEPQNRASST